MASGSYLSTKFFHRVQSVVMVWELRFPWAGDLFLSRRDFPSVGQNRKSVSTESTAAGGTWTISSLEGTFRPRSPDWRHSSLQACFRPRAPRAMPARTAPRAEEEIEMSQRNRIVLAAAVLAALCGVAPAPSQAAGLRPWRVPVVDVWERAWNRLTALLPQGASRTPAARQEKEGGAINPDGHAGFTAPVPPSTHSDEGGMINPDGVK